MDEMMDDAVVTAGTFCKDWLAYTIRQDVGGWRWACTLLGEEFAAGTEPTEDRAVKMAQTARDVRFAAEVRAQSARRQCRERARDGRG